MSHKSLHRFLNVNCQKQNNLELSVCSAANTNIETTKIPQTEILPENVFVKTKNTFCSWKSALSTWYNVFYNYRN